jgi:hypothetical protein
MMDYWDEEDLCPSCLLPSHFAHECNINETHITQHVNHVRNKIRDTSILQYIQEAHKPHSNSLRRNHLVSMNTSFFTQAEGQDVSNIGDLSPISQYHGNSHHNDDKESSESNSQREEDSQSDNSSDDSRTERIRSDEDDEGSSHRGSEFADDMSDNYHNQDLSDLSE